MAERGDAHAKRASNASEYLLAGRVRCQRCGKAFVGAAAQALLHLAIGAFDVLHLETRTFHMTLTIGPFEPFSRASK